MPTPAINAKVETITPFMAEQLLNQQNEDDHRPLKLSAIKRWAGDMRAGRWVLNGESVILSGPRILDGRNRLAAVVEAGVPVEFLVVRNVPSDTFPTIDTGNVRSPGDVFHIAKYANANMLAAAAKLCWAYDNLGTFELQPVQNPSRKELLDYCERRQDVPLTAAATWVNAAKDRRRLTRPALLVAMHALTADHASVRDDFMERLVTGTNLSKDSGLRLLRDRLLRPNPGAHMSVKVAFLGALFVKAWNTEFRGEPCRILRWVTGEEFPLLVTRPPREMGKPLKASKKGQENGESRRKTVQERAPRWTGATQGQAQ